MREHRKKSGAEEMLIVHKPAERPDPDRAGRGPEAAGSSRVPSLDAQELDLLRKRLAAARDPAEKRKLLARIQLKFGNEKAAEAVRDMRGPREDG